MSRGVIRKQVIIKNIFWLLKCGTAILISLLILSFFCFAWSYTGVHVKNETGATDYKWESYRWHTTMKEGVACFRMNDEGFNNSFDKKNLDHIDILLLGSSHMEAANVPQKYNTGYLLNANDDLIIYNIGMSGHTIYQCANNVSNAVKYYNPTKYVIIETDRVLLEEDKMNEVINGECDIIPSYDRGLVYYVQKYVPCFQPIYRELGNWWSADRIEPANKPLEEKSEITNSEEYEAILDIFLEKICKSVDGQKVIIVYHPETQIDDSGIMVPENKKGLDTFISGCTKHDIVFVDMYEDFFNEYVEEERLAHGFYNTEIGVGHLNSTGHRLIANRLWTVIKELEDESK